jgi:hypothetical protein
MHIRSFLTLALGAGALSACNDDVEPVATQLLPAAAIRYVNAVPDTSALDVRFVDGDIEGSPQWVGIGFRSFTGYQRVRSGARQIRIFTNPAPYGNTPAVASQIHIDTTFTFETGARYTIISYGNARASAAIRHRLVIIRDTLPTLTTTQIGVRTIHAAAGVSNVDAYLQLSEAAAGISGPPTAANLAPAQASAYALLTPRPVAALPAGSYRWALAPAGTTTGVTLTPSTSTLLGAAATQTADAFAGVQVGRSVITGIVFPPSVVGSRATQGGDFLNAGLRFLPDRHLDAPGI